MQPYTVCITSCARFDLLNKCLTSLIPRLEGPCEKIVISEDSGDCGVFGAVERFRANSPPIDVIVNTHRLGTTRNIDQAYSLVETEWVFHCEDDWEFYRDGFIHDSFQILQNDGGISSVSLRDRTDFIPGFWKESVVGLEGGRDYFVATDAVAGDIAGIHFNPGLRRMSDYNILGPYGKIAPYCQEGDVSIAYLDAGLRMALLREPAVRHIGSDRHVPLPRPRFQQRIARRIWKRYPRIGVYLT